MTAQGDGRSPLTAGNKSPKGVAPQGLLLVRVAKPPPNNCGAIVGLLEHPSADKNCGTLSTDYPHGQGREHVRLSEVFVQRSHEFLALAGCGIVSAVRHASSIPRPVGLRNCSRLRSRQMLPAIVGSFTAFVTSLFPTGHRRKQVEARNDRTRL